MMYNIFLINIHQYFNLIKNIIENGIKRDDRIKVGTLLIFESSMKFSLKNGYGCLNKFIIIFIHKLHKHQK